VSSCSKRAEASIVENAHAHTTGDRGEELSFDLKTKDKLRNACLEAERQLDQESIAHNASYLEQVSRTPEAERDREEFLRLVWVENPLVNINKTGGAYDVTAALSVPHFRRQFLKFTTLSPSDESADRSVRLDSAYNDTLEEIRQYMPKSGSSENNTDRGV